MNAMKRAAIDATLVAVTVIGTAFVGRLTFEGTLPLATTLGVLVLLRRRWPVEVVLLSVLAIAAMRTAGLTDTLWIWPATVVFASAAAAGKLRWAATIGIVALLSGWSWQLSVLGIPSPAGVGAEALWLAAVLAAAHAYRNWRRWQAEVVARHRQEAHEQQAEAGRRRAEERLRIAHELHDVVAHTLSVVGVHLNVAVDALDTEPAEARESLLVAQEVRAKAMTDLGSLISALRDSDALDPPPTDLCGLPELVARLRSTGLDVTLDETGDPAAVPAPAALAAYRVIQEALTNTVRHAGATHATVTTTYDEDEVRLSVADNGVGPVGGSPVGHGLAGMRERVAALGGVLKTGAHPDGGFHVEATIPLRRQVPVS